MEGWLQVPPERNLIGRPAWKVRYVRFGNSPTSGTANARASIGPSSPIRPTTSGDGNTGSTAVPSNTVTGVVTRLGRSYSTHQVSALQFSAQDARGWNLALFKQKTDHEPVARYSITKIASCYIGDMASSRQKKKSDIQPTLVINLRLDNPSPPASRSFRRRSSETPAKDRKEGSGSASTLLFRPTPDDPNSLERWAREIQSRLLPPSSANKSHSSGIESAFREKFQDSDYDATASSPSSLFLINGEPSTALLSPSIRSQASNLSSIDSEDNMSFMSSVASDMPSPRFSDKRPPSAISEHHSRPGLHLATSPSELDEFDVSPDRTPVPQGGGIAESLPHRRETILDRFFSSGTGPVSPVAPEGGPISSIARFEALLRMEEEEAAENDPVSIVKDNPKRIPSPTQRALEFVSTGVRSTSPLHESSSFGSSKSRRSSIVTASGATLAPVPGRFSGDRNRNSATSDTLSVATSTGGGSIGEVNIGNLGPANHNKRHSLADFSMMRMSTPPLFGMGGPGERRGSGGDPRSVPQPNSDAATGGVGSALIDAGEFGAASGHPKVSRPLFREFSF